MILSDRRRPSPPVVDSLIRYFILLGFIRHVIYCFVTALFFRRVGHDNAVTDAVYEAEDPKDSSTEGMPPSLDHVDPSISNAMICCLLNMHAVLLNSLSCRLTLFIIPDLLSPFYLFKSLSS